MSAITDPKALELLRRPGEQRIQYVITPIRVRHVDR
jgi:hypothetical protein